MISYLLGVQHKFKSPPVIPDFLSKSYFPSLDGWRAIAIIIVLLDHLKGNQLKTTLYYKVANNLIYGNLGVRIFFVLSGFLITTLLIKEHRKTNTISIKKFYLKRILRIFPVLYLYLIVLAILNYFFNLHTHVDGFLGAAFYFSNFSILERGWYTGHTWSLSVEEQYYLIWPWIMPYFKQRVLVFMIIIFVGIVLLKAFWYYFPDYKQISLEPFLSYADAIFMGALFSFLTCKSFFNFNLKIWKSRILVIICCISFPTIYFCIANGYLGFILLPFGSIILNIGICFLLLRSLIHIKSNLYKILNEKFMVKIGLISYSIYIWQQIFLVHRLGQHLYEWQLFPLNIILALLIAYISYHYFESYFLKLKKSIK